MPAASDPFWDFMHKKTGLEPFYILNLDRFGIE